MSSRPPLWSVLQGPSRWFDVSCPPTWKTTENGPTLMLGPTDSDAVLALTARWEDGLNDALVEERIADLVKAFPQLRRAKKVALTNLPKAICSWTGETIIQPPPGLVKKIFGRKEWLRFRVWGLYHGPILVNATLLHGKQFDPEIEALTAMVLRTLEFAEFPADPPEVFAQRVLKLARAKFPLLEIQAGKDFQLQVGESTLNLFNFYRAYVDRPDKFEETVLPALTTIVQVQGWGDAQITPSLDSVRQRIMPMLYPETVWRTRFEHFVGVPWVAGLATLYVVDESNAYWYIRKDLLEKWELSVDDLHTLAMTNLHEYFERKPMEIAVAGTEETGPSMLMPGHADSYNAARLLSESFVGRLREVVGGNFAVGIPGRDFFVAVNLRKQEMVDHVRKKVREDFERIDHPLTDELLLVSLDGVSQYESPAEQNARNALEDQQKKEGGG